ncbi:MAG: hypothetical protein ACRDE5_05910 [Ginsengibacter sp.]
MKKIFKSPDTFHNVKNFLFAFYLLVVSVSLPVLSFVQAGYPVNKTDSKEHINDDSTKQDQMSAQKEVKTVSIS